jgi:hypothetical protein
MSGVMGQSRRVGGGGGGGAPPAPPRGAEDCPPYLFPQRLRHY